AGDEPARRAHRLQRSLGDGLDRMVTRDQVVDSMREKVANIGATVLADLQCKESRDTDRLTCRAVAARPIAFETWGDVRPPKRAEAAAEPSPRGFNVDFARI